ncbi:hypothetical protein KIMH_10420 [Bombiscardovia apis]|uniref:VWFA domain-containing protein n=1 Tax=Bombiscardovia apis TaxID=2932182 RepID=A0ABN6SHW9_9BIFI|nr:VWA domain-containing protein [Bombiscardovia apis]BDR54931.1 hypothetical protein KIMH_10420 [Bombiscardovia apis]
MKGWTLAPSLGWIVGGLLAAILVVLTIAGPIMYRRSRGTTDASKMTVARRSLITALLAMIVLTPSQVQQVANRAVNATDVFIAVDVTGSMAVDDAHYGSNETITRLTAAKQAVQDIVNIYPDASFAAVHFGASASVDLPITPDTRAVNNWASNLSTEPTSLSAGSSLDAPINALTLSLKERKDQHPDHAVLLYIISDGEQTSAKNRQSFSTLRAYVDSAFTIGVGSTAGGKIPVSADGITKPGSAQQDWVIDPQTGQPGISVMDESQLKAIADELSGYYIGTDSTHTAVNGPSAQISKRYQVSVSNSKRQRVVPVVWPFAFAVLALLAWEMANWIRMSRRLL